MDCYTGTYKCYAIEKHMLLLPLPNNVLRFNNNYSPGTVPVIVNSK